jgi:hypothetical protein
MADVGQNQFAIALDQLKTRLSDEIHLQFEVLSVHDRTVRGSIQFVFTADKVIAGALPAGTSFAVFSTVGDQCTTGTKLNLTLGFNQVNNFITLRSDKHEVDMTTNGTKVEHFEPLVEHKIVDHETK